MLSTFSGLQDVSALGSQLTESVSLATLLCVVGTVLMLAPILPGLGERWVYKFVWVAGAVAGAVAGNFTSQHLQVQWDGVMPDGVGSCVFAVILAAICSIVHCPGLNQRDKDCPWRRAPLCLRSASGPIPDGSSAEA